jgi:hypothetical protein
MNERDEALKKAKALPTKANSLGAYIKQLVLRGFFDSPTRSPDIIRAVKDQFGRRFPVSYVQTYMKPFLRAGILRAHGFEGGRGNTWLGAWLTGAHGAEHDTGERLRLKVDTTGWDPEVAEDFHLAVSCYTNKLWKSAAVMVRRAYEGALTIKYRTMEGTDPEKQATCPKCSTKLGIRPLSITDLHNWAVRNNLVREKMDGLSILLKDLGAGGAHPTKTRVLDPETAEIILKCGGVLLHDLRLRTPDLATVPASHFPSHQKEESRP